MLGIDQNIPGHFPLTLSGLYLDLSFEHRFVSPALPFEPSRPAEVGA